MEKLLVGNHLKIADIGASGSPHSRWDHIAEYCDFFLFEADDRAEIEITKGKYGKVHSINQAVSDRREDITLNLCNKQQVSSVYLPNQLLLRKFPACERFDVVGETTIKADRLDNLVSEEMDLVKIDVQGHELAVIKGMGDLLNDTIAIEVEVSFIEIYKNQPLFFDVDNYLKEYSFELFDLNRYFWRRDSNINYGSRRGQLTFGEALYFKSPEVVCSSLECTQDKVIRAAWIYKSYGYYDLVELLAQLAKEKNLIDSTTYKELMIECMRNEHPHFPILGRGRIQSDERLGN